MKLHPWTSGLVTAGVVSLGSVASAEEAQLHPVVTTLASTTLSGYVDTSAIVNFGSGNIVVGRSFDGPSKQDGFNFNVAKVQLEKGLDEGKWSAGYRVSLMFGPDANALASTSTGVNLATSDFAVKNAYVSLRAPVGNGLDFKIGVWDTMMGYEVMEAGSNPNYSRSFGFWLEPIIHTGVSATYRFSDWLAVSGAIADPSNIYSAANTINARSTVSSLFSYMGSVSLTAPESAGFLKGGTLTGAIMDHGMAGEPDVLQFYAGATIPLPLPGFAVGGAYDYRGQGSGDFPGISDYANALGGYVTWQITEKLKAAGRVEYAWGSNGTWYATEFSEKNELLGVTGTLDYSLWANVISRVEVRWDHVLSGPGIFNDGTDENSVSLALNVIYQF